MPYARRDPHLVVPTWSTNIPGNSHTSENHSNRLQMHLLPEGQRTLFVRNMHVATVDVCAERCVCY